MASDVGVFAISVAAEMTSMQVQNLRVYERRGLLEHGNGVPKPLEARSGGKSANAAPYDHDSPSFHSVRSIKALRLAFTRQQSISRVTRPRDDCSRARWIDALENITSEIRPSTAGSSYTYAHGSINCMSNWHITMRCSIYRIAPSSDRIIDQTT